MMANDFGLFAGTFQDGATGGTLEIGVLRASCADPCGCRPEWPDVTPLMLETSFLIERFYDLPGCSVGGPLHILTDDQNVKDGNLAFCWEAVFDEPRGWWRDDQTPDESALTERMGCAILWGFGAMTMPERHLVADRWPLTDPMDKRFVAPHQAAYLIYAQWGWETERPDWVCDECWDSLTGGA